MTGFLTTQEYCREFVGVPMTEDNLFFYSLVRTIKDYISYGGPGKNKMVPWDAYSFARRWINGYIPRAQWGESDLELSFEEALEMIGVAPENIPIIRELLNSAATAPVEERAILCKKAYGLLAWQDNEIEEFAFVNRNRNYM